MLDQILASPQSVMEVVRMGNNSSASNTSNGATVSKRSDEKRLSLALAPPKLSLSDHTSHHSVYAPVPTATKRLSKAEILACMKEMKKKIQWIKQLGAVDLQELEDEHNQAKFEYRRQLQEKMGLNLDDDATALEEDAGSAACSETLEEIQSLRESNVSLRQEMVWMQKEMEELKASNQALEKDTLAKLQACKDIAQHVERLEGVHTKLQAKCDTAEASIAKLRSEYATADSHYKAESKTTEAYQRSIAKIVAEVEEKSHQMMAQDDGDLEYVDAYDLVDDLYEISGQGSNYSRGLRTKELSVRGLRVPKEKEEELVPPRSPKAGADARRASGIFAVGRKKHFLDTSSDEDSDSSDDDDSSVSSVEIDDVEYEWDDEEDDDDHDSDSSSSSNDEDDNKYSW